MKHCPKCDESKPLTEFYPAKARKDGYSGWCKKCFSQHQKSKYKLKSVYGKVMPLRVVRQKRVKQDLIVKYGAAVADILNSTDWDREHF